MWDLIEYIEAGQCFDCAFKTDVAEYPMCNTVMVPLVDMEPVEVLDDKGDDGVVCTRYRHAELAEQEHESQGRLFDVDGRGN